LLQEHHDFFMNLTTATMIVCSSEGKV